MNKKNFTLLHLKERSRSSGPLNQKYDWSKGVVTLKNITILPLIGYDTPWLLLLLCPLNSINKSSSISSFLLSFFFMCQQYILKLAVCFVGRLYLGGPSIAINTFHAKGKKPSGWKVNRCTCHVCLNEAFYLFFFLLLLRFMESANRHICDIREWITC